jgi:hypothetical protein
VPHLLREIVTGRHRVVTPAGAESDLLSSGDLGADAWTRLPAERCRRLGMAVVDRVQTRLEGLPDSILETPLPDPATALTFRIELRTANTLRRAMASGTEGPWTLRRYLGVRRFGGRAVVDLLAAAEANGGGAKASEIVAERISDRAIAIIARQLPISEKRVNGDLAGYGVATPFDLPALARSTVRRGRTAPFQVIEIGGARLAVRLLQVTAARAAYRISARSVQGWGATTIAGVADLLGTVPGSERTDSFVEQLLVDVPAFRWIDRQNGWFWFVGRSNPLLDDLRKILSVTSRLPVSRLWNALFHVRPGRSPAPGTLDRICVEIPGARIVAGELSYSGRLDRSRHLGATEERLVAILEAAGGSLSGAGLRKELHAQGLSWTPAAQLVRSSPLFTTSSEGLVRLL